MLILPKYRQHRIMSGTPPPAGDENSRALTAYRRKLGECREIEVFSKNEKKILKFFLGKAEDIAEERAGTTEDL